jgi:hypothetical protein
MKAVKTSEVKSGAMTAFIVVVGPTGILDGIAPNS